MKKTLTILFIAFGGIAVAVPVRSIVAARNAVVASTEQSHHTAADYIQDGLIIMFDGIENAGWGLHNANATNWVELIGQFTILDRGNKTFENNCALFSYGNGKDRIQIEYITPANGLLTVETMFMPTKDQPQHFIVTQSYNGGWALAYYRNSGDAYFNACDKIDGAYKYQHTLFAVNEKNRFTCIIDSDCLRLMRNGKANEPVAFNALKRYSAGSSYSWTIIGAADWFGNGAMIGRVYFVRIYNRALSGEEIQHNYQIDKERFGIE